MSNLIKATCLIAACATASIATAQTASIYQDTGTLSATNLTTTKLDPSLVATTKDEAPRLIGDNEISEEELVKLLDESIPSYDRSILQARSDRDIVAELNFERLADVLGDQVKELPPEGATQILGDHHAFRLDAKTGKVRYVNRERAWDYRYDAGKPAVSAGEAARIVEGTLAKLGLPFEELSKPIIRPQIAAGAKAGADEIQEKHEMYQFSYIERTINGLQVYQSDAKLAINNRGEVQRLALEWPHFELNPEEGLREREDVLRSTAKQILSQDPDSSLTIQSKLAYAQVGGEENFKPVAVISVNSLPTPYQLIVELSDLSAGGDNK